MSDTMQSLEQLAALKTATPEAPKHVKKVDKYGRARLGPGPGELRADVTRVAFGGTGLIVGGGG